MGRNLFNFQAKLKRLSLAYNLQALIWYRLHAHSTLHLQATGSKHTPFEG